MTITLDYADLNLEDARAVKLHERVTRDLLATYPGLADSPEAEYYLAPLG